ncbi:MAG: CHASE3 domain-containing protein, partial [Chthoniobacterales bacterium]
MKRSVGKGSAFGFILAVIVLSVSGWIASVNIRRISRNDALVIHTHEVLDGIRDTLATLAIAESSQRSYLITGEAVYLKPYRSAADAVRGHVGWIKSLTVDNPEEQNRIPRLEVLVADRITSLQT